MAGWKSFVFKEKLKLLKAKIRVWQQEVYGGLFVEISTLVDVMDKSDLRLCNEMLMDNE